MSQFFNSSPSFAFTSNNSSPHRNISEYQNSQIGDNFMGNQWAQNIDDVVYFLRKKLIFRIVSIIDSKIRYHQRLSIRKLQLQAYGLNSSQRRIMQFMEIESALKHYQLAQNRIIKRQIVEKLKQHMKNERMLELAKIDKFCNKYLNTRIHQCSTILISWLNNQDNRSFEIQKYKYGLKIVIRCVRNYKIKYFTSIKDYQPNKNTVVIRQLSAITKISQSFSKKHLQIYRLFFSILQQPLKIDNQRDTPQIYDDLLQHICFLTNRQAQKSKLKQVKNEQKSIQIKIKMMVRVLKTNEMDIVKQGFKKIKQEYFQAKNQIIKRVRELQILKEQVIEDLK